MSTLPSLVQFYVLGQPSADARLRLACRIVEKAYLANCRVLVWHDDPQELRQFDDLLWTFADRSFVPHEFARPDVACEAPVQLATGTAPETRVDLLVNLAAEVPPCVGLATEVAEVLDGDAVRRQAGRARFRAYRELGLQPLSHNVTEGGALPESRPG